MTQSKSDHEAVWPMPLAERLYLVILGAIAGGAAASYFRSTEAAGSFSSLIWPSVVTIVLLILLRSLTRKFALFHSPPSRDRFLRFDLLTYLPVLATLAVPYGLRLIPPVLFLIATSILFLKVLALLLATPSTQRKQATSSLPYLAFLFLISGLAALIYQVVWQRLLFTAFGTNIESITLIVSLFMLGLGIGSLAGGWIADRHPRTAPWLFLACESGIGLFGLVSIPLIQFISRLTLHASLVTISLAIFSLLIFPTMLMGATLPILVGHLHRHYQNVGRSVGILYCINTLGSAIACFLAADFLFVITGQRNSVLFAALCNFVAGFLIWKYIRRTSASATASTEAPKTISADPHPHSLSLAHRLFVLLFAAITGYISLSQEMLWMRYVSYMTGGKPQVFAHVLGFFLIGIALGAYYAERLCTRQFSAPSGEESIDSDRTVCVPFIGNLSENQAPSVTSSPIRFIGGMLLISSLVYYYSIPLTAELYTHSAPAGMLVMHLIVALVSFLLGGIFPVLCHYASRSGTSVTLSVSRLYLANIIGSTLGPLLTGFVLMNLLPTDRIVLYLSLATLVLGAFAFLFKDAPAPSASASPLLTAVLAGAFLLFIHPYVYSHLLSKLHFGPDYNSALNYKRVIENRSGIIAVGPDYTSNTDILYGGGMYDGNFSIDPVLDSNGISRAYAVAALHPNPRSILEIGLASGSWSRVLASYQPVRSHAIIEINPGYLDLIKSYSPQADLLTDPRVHIHIDDGRRWLNRHSDQTFDLIVQNTTWHWRDHITNLLSVEYLQLCRSHLNPNGVLYFNTTGSDDAARTAAEVFQHIVRVKNFVAASDAPFSLAPDQIHHNLFQFVIHGSPIFAPTDPDTLDALHNLTTLDLTDRAPELRANPHLHLITDDNMRTEYKEQLWWKSHASHSSK